MKYFAVFNLFTSASCVLAFGVGSSLKTFENKHELNISSSRGGKAGRRHGMFMFQDGAVATATPVAKKLEDKTRLGNLMVPSVGIGTISWSSKSCK